MVKAPSSMRPSPQGSSPVFSSSLTCNYCKNPGHIKANCYRLVGFLAGYFDRPRPQDNKPKGKAAVTKPDHTNFTGKDTASVSCGGNGKIGVALKISGFTGGNTWIIDSGASDHMTYDRSFFLFLNPPSISSVVNANGDSFPVLGIGSVRLTPSLTLHDVLYVPDLSHHLISVPQLNTQSRCSVTFFPLYVIFQDLLTREIIGRGYLRGRLFHLDCMFAGMKPEKAVQAALISTGVTNQVEELWLWHRRLGHPSFSVMKKSMPSLFLGIDESKLHCESCVLAKSHRTSYPLSTTRSSSPFELIHSDVWGPSRESTLSGKHWFFHQFFHSHGIIHQTTCPQTPEQNGVSERKNRHVLDIARSHLFSAHMPKYLWGDAILTACHLINRLPSSVLNGQTPYAALSNHVSVPSFSNLPARVFGCVVFVHVPKNQRSKLDARALKCVFVGYGVNQKGYKCFHPPTQKVFVTMDVTFYEDACYFSPINPSLQGEKHTFLEEKSCGIEIQPIEANVTPAETEKSIAEQSIASSEIETAIAESSTLRHATAEQSIASSETETAIAESSTLRHATAEQSIASSEIEKTIAESSTLREGQAPPPLLDTDNPCQPILEERPNLEVSGVSSNSDIGDSVHVLPPRSTSGKPPRQYEPSLDVKSKYAIANFVSTHRLSKSHASFVNQISSVCVPSKVQDALKDPKWSQAMNEEMEALEKNNTWKLVPPPQGKRVVGCRWVYTIKHNADGSVNRYKARLVAKGYTQTYGVDYEETFAPVAKINTVRVLMSLAANLDWPLQQFDVKNAFLHGELSEEEVERLKDLLASEFEMKDLGSLKYFLGIEVARGSSGIFLCQRKYVLDLLTETGMLGCRPADTPIEQNHKLAEYPNQTLTKKARYQRLVGRLIYLSHTRPDIAYAVSVVSQFMHNPSETHMEAVIRILRYLKSAPGKGLMFSKHSHLDISGYTDADWAGCVTDRKSTSGYFTFVGGNLVTWRSKKQKVVARSSAEAEYRGMAHGVCELLWLRNLLRDLGFKPKRAMNLYCDNKAAVDIAHNPVQHDRTKHVEVDRHFIKEKLDAKLISFPFVHSEEQLADVLTKAVSISLNSQTQNRFLNNHKTAPTQCTSKKIRKWSKGSICASCFLGLKEAVKSKSLTRRRTSTAELGLEVSAPSPKLTFGSDGQGLVRPGGDW
ncbi:putative RNA-directed DNA polymerase [Rosa chinensis]|uniref:Putative RNA-directed DNA polymerase n=1 Tax=Rosa chinensis TaxID=74649 RepID=A0A2P6RMC5_ROSCH|nr:putative RNA-directed DNA polymerase [Rosa chinensis]